MPSLKKVIQTASRGADLYFVFRFLRLLTAKYTATKAYKLGIIDKKGKPLKKSSDLTTSEEKSSYTMLHRLTWKIRGLIEKIPLIGKSILLNYAAALFLLKEQKDPRIWTDEGYMKRKLMEFIETDWDVDAQLLKEEVDNMEKKSFQFLRETTVETEASTYRDRTKDDEKEKKRKGGKLPPSQKGSRWGRTGYGKGHEEVEVDEAKEFWAVIDKAKGGEVMAISSDEKGAKSSVKTSNFSKHDYHFGKDPRTLKIVKVAGSYKQGEKMIGTKLSFKEDIEKAFKEFVEEIDERKMTDAEMAEREEIVKKMKPKLQSFKDRYGDDAKKVMYATATKQAMEEVEIEEKKSATGYELYHKTFSDAMQHAYAHAKSKGFVVDPKEIDDKVATGPKKPSSGKTNRYSLKAGRKKVEIQVANLDNKRYELNMYIEEVELDEAFSMGKGDKRVVDAFYDQKEIKAHGASILTTDGKTLTKRGMGGQDIAKWVNGKIKIVAVSDVKSTELILKYMKKSIPSGVFEEMGNVAPTAPDSGGIQYQAPVLGQKKKKKKQTIDEAVQRTTFAGKDVFIVDSETFYNCRLGKKKYGRYEKYVGKGKVGQTIREYGLKYPRRPIILQNGESGPMLYLKYGRS